MPEFPKDQRVSESPRARALRRFAGHRVSLAAAVMLVVALILVSVAPWWSRYDANQLSDSQFAPPSGAHWLGTDANGRDVLARICAGSRVSLLVGGAGAAVSLVIGVLWGATAGYVGGRIDGTLMRAADILYSMPSVIFFIVLFSAVRDPVTNGLAAYFGAGAAEYAPLVILVPGLGAISWVTMARIVRSAVVSLRRRPYVEASRALGAGHLRILGRHILPNTSGLIVAYLMLTVPEVILQESFLSYLGLGIQPPQASLGSLIADGAGQINPIRTYWWLLAGPAVVLVVLLLSLSFVADGLRDAFDPQVGSED